MSTVPRPFRHIEERRHSIHGQRQCSQGKLESKKPSKLAARLRFTFQHTVQISIPSNNFSPNSKPSCAKIAAYTLKNAAYTVDSLCEAIVFCLDEIPDPSALHISLIQVRST